MHVCIPVKLISLKKSVRQRSYKEKLLEIDYNCKGHTKNIGV
jgi:hypothetical protein